MYTTRRLIVRLTLAGVALLQGCALLSSQPPLWQPDEWPLTTYRVEWNALRLWVAIEGDADGLVLVAFSPEGVKMVTARYADGQLEQPFNPLRPAGLDAESLLEGWQLAFGEPAAVASVYGSDCRFQALAEAVRELRCKGKPRARIDAQGRTAAVQAGGEAVQRWTPLHDPESRTTGLAP